MTYIYFIQPEDGGPIKIGLANDPKRRLIVIQVNHWMRLVLRCVTEGDRAVEQSLHRRFSYCRLMGEWFHPTEELLDYIATLPPLNWSPSRGVWGEENPRWTGPNARIETKRARVQLRYPVGPCWALRRSVRPSWWR